MSTEACDIVARALKSLNGFETSRGKFFFGSAGEVDPAELVAAIRAAGGAVVTLPEPPKSCENCAWRRAGGDGECPGRWCEKKRDDR